MVHRSIGYWLAGALLAGACGDSGSTDTPDAGGGTVAVLKRPSKSSTIAITDDDRFVAMVNPEDGSISVFRTADNMLTAKVVVGPEPSSIAIAPDNTTAYVSLAAAAGVVKVTGIDGAAPRVSSATPVGAEPMAVALSPTGKKLFVAAFAEGNVSVIDTATMTVTTTLKGNIKNPRALAVTNNGDTSDDDELLLVPEFYGEVVSGFTGDANTIDKARQGRVRIYDVATLTAQNAITFAAFDTGIAPDSTTLATVFTSPNQLASVIIRRDPSAPGDLTKARIYVPSVSASPQAPTKFNTNVFPVVYVGDLGARAEVPTAGGGTVNLAASLLAASPAGSYAGKLFLADIVDMAFLPTQGAVAETGTAYVISRGADAVQRVVFDTSGVTLGISGKLQIDVVGLGTDAADVNRGCKGPTGIVLPTDGSRAYVNCWVSKRLGVVDLGGTQALNTTVESVAPATDPAKQSQDRGRRFFFTGRGRWSGNGTLTTAPTTNNLAFSSCGSCHPSGYSDNITWIFDTGPRQTTELSGTFAKGQISPGKQRILNWTGIFDEIHDFERNTRGVSGGIGALTTASTGVLADCKGNLSKEVRKGLVQQDGVTASGGLDRASREIMVEATTCVPDWDDVEAWVKTVRPPQGLRSLDSGKVALGAHTFGAGTGNDVANCAGCHGGSGFTVSRRFWTPSQQNNNGVTAFPNGLTVTAFTKPGVPFDPTWNFHTKEIEIEQLSGAAGVAPGQVACVIRSVGTFGLAALEKKNGADPAALALAQGQGGYNVPSLYGLSIGAPYFHNGEAASLDEILDFSSAGKWKAHLFAGNPNWVPTADAIDGLKQYLLSIDGTTLEPSIPAGFEACRGSFSNP